MATRRRNQRNRGRTGCSHAAAAERRRTPNTIQPPREAECTGADAANWYIGTFQNRLAERQAQALLDQQAAAQRRQLLIPALSGIGTAIGALLMFLILPLLIQIERNTRTA